MALGSLLHAMLLGKGAEIEIVAADDWRTKAAREARDRAREEGRIAVLEHIYSGAELAATSIRKRLVDRREPIDLSSRDGESELAIVWREDATIGPVWARGMLDRLERRATRAVIYDLKTCRSAHPRSCASHVIEYGYDLQGAAYTRAVAAAWPELAGRVDFVFIFAETEAPYAVTVGRVDGAARERGERRWREAVERWARCIRTDEWPLYEGDGEVVTLESPGWVLAQLADGEL
jgi:hypothetical protein